MVYDQISVYVTNNKYERHLSVPLQQRVKWIAEEDVASPVARVAAAFVICVAALTRELVRDALLQTSLMAISPLVTAPCFTLRRLMDSQRTEEVRRLEAEKVPNYYRIDRNVVNGQIQILKEHIARLQEERPKSPKPLLRRCAIHLRINSGFYCYKGYFFPCRCIKRKCPDWNDFPSLIWIALRLTPDMSSLPERDLVKIVLNHLIEEQRQQVFGFWLSHLRNYFQKMILWEKLLGRTGIRLLKGICPTESPNRLRVEAHCDYA